MRYCASVNEKEDPFFLIDNFIAVCILRNSDATVCFGNKKKKTQERMRGKNTHEQSVDTNPKNRIDWPIKY